MLLADNGMNAALPATSAETDSGLKAAFLFVKVSRNERPRVVSSADLSSWLFVSDVNAFASRRLACVEILKLIFSETEPFIMMLLHDDSFILLFRTMRALFIFYFCFRVCYILLLFRGFGHSMSRFSLLLALVIGKLHDIDAH